MRNRFFLLLEQQMKQDEDIFFLYADMGLGIVENLHDKFPNRVLNVGIAEQNMIGVAAGLCNAGFRPFCYTISNFLTQRCFEHIRNDICMTSYPVTLVGTSVGFENGILGNTHYAIDDIGCMQLLPDMRIYSPSSLESVDFCMRDILKDRLPAYIRLPKQNSNIHTATAYTYYAIEAPVKDILLLTYGNTAEYCCQAAKNFKGVSVYCIDRLKPLSAELIANLFSLYRKIWVVEEQQRSAGLFQRIALILLENKFLIPEIASFAIPDTFSRVVGQEDFLASQYGLTAGKLVELLKVEGQNEK